MRTPEEDGLDVELHLLSSSFISMIPLSPVTRPVESHTLSADGPVSDLTQRPPGTVCQTGLPF